MGVKWQDFCSHAILINKIRNYDIDMDTMEATIRRRRLSYFGHICRMPKGRLPRIILHGEVNFGGRRAGGPEVSYCACLKKDIELFSINVGGNFDTSEHLALDKSVWQKLVRDGSEVFMDTWLKEELKISYETFIVEYINIMIMMCMSY
jgi:hypothetical protein